QGRVFPALIVGDGECCCSVDAASMTAGRCPETAAKSTGTELRERFLVDPVRLHEIEPELFQRIADPGIVFEDVVRLQPPDPRSQRLVDLKVQEDVQPL